METDGTMAPGRAPDAEADGSRDGFRRWLIDREDGLLARSRVGRGVLASIFLVLAGVALWQADQAFGDAVGLQFADGGEALAAYLRDGDAVREHLAWDVGFILSATLGALLWASVINAPTRARPSVRLTAYAFILGAAAMDLVEDLVTWRAVDANRVTDAWAGAITAFAGLKWLLVGGIAVLALGAIGRRLTPSDEAASMFLGESRRPRDAVPVPRYIQEAWAPPGSPVPPGAPSPPTGSVEPVRRRTGIGIACSGGGIRSASFCLGALHGLGPGIVRKADYLAAASGGAYIAAAMTAREYGREAEAARQRAALAHTINDLTPTPPDPAAGGPVDEAAPEPTAGGSDATAAGDGAPADPVALVQAVLDKGTTLVDKPKLRAEGDAVAEVMDLADQAVQAAQTSEEHEAAAAAQDFAASVQAVQAFDSPLPFGQEPAPGASGIRRDSDELSRLRARVSYLLLNGDEGRVSVFRAVSGLLINLVVLGLVLFAVARPIGWTMSSAALHPELRANLPLIHEVRPVESPPAPGMSTPDDRDLATADFTLGPPVEVDCAEDEGPGTQRDVLLDSSEIPVAFDFLDDIEGDPAEAVGATLGQTEPGLVEICAGRVEVLDQPGLGVVLAHGGEDGLSCVDDVEPCVAADIEIETAGLIDAASDVVSQEEADGDHAAAVIEVGDQPTYTSESGSQGRKDITIDGWMWGLAIGALMVAILTSTFGFGSLRGRHELTTQLPKSALIALSISGATFALAIALPWASQEIPERFGDAASGLPGAAEGVWGFLVWLAGFLAAARAALAGLRKDAEAKTSSGKRKSRLVLKVGAMVFLVFMGLIALFTVLQSPVLNGPNGTVHGGSWYWSQAWLRVPDLVLLAVVVGVLLIIRRAIPTYVWSLNPLYRDRLGKAFLGDARDQDVSTRVREATILGQPQPAHPWPELVVCAAVNLNSSDAANRIPSGRWADSFTFSREAIGSPATRYVPSAEYADALAYNRHTDLQLSSLVAVSGAAFSPGMGKEAYGALGGLLAVLNLRLGLWLPSPAWVARMKDRRAEREQAGPPWWSGLAKAGRDLRGGVRRLLGRPERVEDPRPYTWRVTAGWPYLLREVFGRFRRTSPYVYVTDGGHWENLGLVELIRRGCTEIYVLSAAGDGAQSFSTAGEAIALAREQFGVDIHIELTPLRSRTGGETAKTGRQLLDLENDSAERSFAPEPYAVGWFTYDNGVRARILFIEANLTDDLPWDVHSHAERHAVFPDDSTMNQFFNHRQFESYRRLGRHQAEAALAADVWNTMGSWQAGHGDDKELRRLLARVAESSADGDAPAKATLS